MSLAIKPGVSIQGLRPEMVLALVVCAGVYAERGRVCTLTSGLEGAHSRASLHYTGSAVDLRTRDLTPTDVGEVAGELADRLGIDFDVVVERTHIHVEFQPKEGA